MPAEPQHEEAGEPPECDDRRAAERNPHDPFRDRLPPLEPVVGDQPAPEQVAERIACPADGEKGDDGPAGGPPARQRRGARGCREGDARPCPPPWIGEAQDRGPPY